jgi:hypothetical protein
LPDLELVPMPLVWAVYESVGHMRYLYFPTTSIISPLYVMQGGASAETPQQLLPNMCDNERNLRANASIVSFMREYSREKNY